MVCENQELLLCDFDLCGYNYRGFDFAALFMQFNDPNVNEFRVKDPEVVEKFIARYLEHCKRIEGLFFS